MTVWYDVTTSLRATSRNGIANVEWSIGAALRDTSADVRFFALAGRNRLVEVSQAELAGAFYASGHRPAPSAFVIAAPTWRDRVRAGLRATLGPRSVRVIRSLSALYQSPKRWSDWLAARRAHAPQDARVATLADAVQAGDVVVSMGADWEGGVAALLGDLRRTTGCRVITMVYDLIPITHTHLAFHKEPELFVRYYLQLLVGSDVITCISEQSRQDLLTFAAEHGVAMPRTEVLYLGEHVATPVPAGPRGDFYLWVGTIERRKNLDLLYDALRILETAGAELPTIVVAGPFGWGVDDLRAELVLRSTAASRAIVMLGPVDDDVLDGLYRRARGLLFPSHYEGWGLPVREAAVRGCPVAAGDSPALREATRGVVGAVLMSTDDPSEWAEYLRRGPEPTTPAPARPWTATAADLLAFVE